MPNNPTSSVVRVESAGNLALIADRQSAGERRLAGGASGLASAIEAAGADPAVEGIVIACEGRTFVAGAISRNLASRRCRPP